MPNRLAQSASPYLRQHATNPVDWYEWGPEAFKRARSEGKPLLVSIGYSACHWCHVMAHESFEDPEIASVMNDLFINIKVDREERPDIDSIYMEATQAMTGQGGWPMTVWLAPDGKPFYAGTYFPKIDRHGRPAFRRVMEAVADAWANRWPEVEAQASRISEAISRKLPVSSELPTIETLTAAYEQLERHYDPVHGGFGPAPKFPQQPVLEYLLRIHRRAWAPKAGSMLRHTLIRMASGGIWDVVGGGFARYSVDDRWLVPHFEKMLYDNAQLARLYTWAWVELGNQLFRQVAYQTFEYLLGDLRHPGGGFCSAEDADSEGVEGKFYLWSADELRDVLGPDAPIAMDLWGVRPEGNFEGSNLLHTALTVPEAAERHGMEISEVGALAERSRAALAARRRGRVRPGLDDKIVASWNGLTIRALAEAGAVFADPRLLNAARECAGFLLTALRPRGRLRRTWTAGSSGPPAFLEDYAGAAVGLFALYAATGETEWFEAAADLTREIPERFRDPDGGLFSTANDSEDLIKRPKDQMDNPLPSGSSLAAEAFIVLASYTGDPTLRSLAEDTIRSAGTVMATHPTAFGHLLSVLASAETQEVAIVGPEAPGLATVFWERHRPHAVLAVSDRPTEEVPLLAGRGAEDRTLAYVCRDFVCRAPVSTPDALRQALG